MNYKFLTVFAVLLGVFAFSQGFSNKDAKLTDEMSVEFKIAQKINDKIVFDNHYLTILESKLEKQLLKEHNLVVQYLASEIVEDEENAVLVLYDNEYITKTLLHSDNNGGFFLKATFISCSSSACAVGTGCDPVGGIVCSACAGGCTKTSTVSL
jgi:hypothetical protein